MRLSHRMRSTAIAAGLILLLSACGSGPTSTDPTTGDGTATLNLGVYPNNSLSLPIAVAQSQGLFAAAKLEVTTVPGKSGPELSAALIGGSTQIAGNTPQSALPAIRDGQSLVVIPPVAALNYLIAGPAEIADHGVAALKGQRIGITARGSATETFARSVLSDNGLNPDQDVTFVAVGGSATMVPAYSQDQIDAFVGTPSTIAVMRGHGNEVAVIADATNGTAGPLGQYGYGGFFTTTKDVLATSPVTVQRFCDAMRGAGAYIADLANRNAVVATLAELVGLPEDQAVPVYEAEHALWTNDLTADRWKKNAEWVLGADADKAPFDTSTSIACS